MEKLSITEITKKTSVLKDALEKHGTVKIIWKEQKPNGKVIFSAIVKAEKVKEDKS